MIKTKLIWVFLIIILIFFFGGTFVNQSQSASIKERAAEEGIYTILSSAWLG